MYKHDLDALKRRLFEQVGYRDGESWKQLVLENGTEHPHYMISSHGRVLSLPRWRDRPNGKSIWKGKVISPSPQRSGHMRFNVRVDGVNKTILVHRAVMWTFMGPQPKGIFVRHLDGDPANNHLENLAYSKPWENIADTFSPRYDNGIGIIIDSSLEQHIASALAGKVSCTRVLTEVQTLIEKSKALV